MIARPIAHFAAYALIVYGLKLGSYHQQNVKYELNVDVEPTGRLFHIDIGGWDLLLNVARAARLPQIAGMSTAENLFIPPLVGQALEFPALGGDHFSRQVNRRWELAYIDEFIATIEKLLDVDLAQASLKDPRTALWRYNEIVTQFINSEDGLRQIEQKHLEWRRDPSELQKRIARHE